MATKYAEVVGMMLDIEPLVDDAGTLEFATALVAFEMPAYTATTDTISIGAGGTDRGATTTDTLATMIQNERRDGKTVTLKSAMLCRPGSQGGVLFYTGALAISSGSLTGGIKSSDESTEATAAAGIHDQPVAVLVRYALS